VTRAQLLEIIEERFKKIEEVEGGHRQAEVDGAVGSSNRATEARAGEGELEGEPGHRS
jgi:hypothetical protein